jgi:hypothetical protein
MTIGRINACDTAGSVADRSAQIGRHFDCEVTLHLSQTPQGKWRAEYRAWTSGEVFGIFAFAEDHTFTEAAEAAKNRLVRQLSRQREVRWIVGEER